MTQGTARPTVNQGRAGDDPWPVLVDDAASATNQATEIALLEEIRDGVNDIAIDADTINLNADQINLNTDEVESKLDDLNALVQTLVDAYTPVQGHVTTVEMTTPLTSAEVYTTVWYDLRKAPSANVFALFFGAKPTQVRVQWSNDGINPITSFNDLDIVASKTLAGLYTAFLSFNAPVGQYFRVRITNGATAQTANQLVTWVLSTQFNGVYKALNAPALDYEVALLTRAVGAGLSFHDQFTNAVLPEHTQDDQNSLLTPLTNGVATAFTVDTGTDRILATAHGLASGDAVVLSTDGTLPAPFTHSTPVAASGGNEAYDQETVYWVINPTTDDFQLTTNITATSPVAVDITDAGTGSHTFQKRGQFVGVFKDYSQVGHGLDFFFDLQRPALLRSEWSTNGTTVGDPIGGLFALSARQVTVVAAPPLGDVYVQIAVQQTMIAKYRRVRIVNGPAAQTPGLYALATFIGKANYPGTFGGLNDALSSLTTALITRSVTAGFNPDGGFENINKQGRHSANSTTTPLNGDTGGSDHIFRGEWFEWQNKYAGLIVDATSDVAGTLHIDFAEVEVPTNGVDTDVVDFRAVEYDPVLTPLLRRSTQVQSRWVRIRYVNGIAAQSEFAIDCAFLTAGQVLSTQPASILPTNDNLVLMANALLVAQSEDGNSFTHVRVTEDPLTNKLGINVNLTKTDHNVPIESLQDFEPGQVTVSHTDAVQIPDPPITMNAKSLAITNTDDDTKVYMGKETVLATTGHAILPSTGFDLEIDGSIPVFLIAEDTGASTSTSSQNGATTVNHGTTSPGNILTADDNRTVFDDQGDAVDVSGFAITPTLAEVSAVKLKLEGRKASTPTTEIVEFVSVVTGTAGNVGSVVSGTVTADANDFYLVVVSRRNAAAAVSSVTGMGATWVQVDDISSDNGDTRTTVYRNSTPPTTNGAVTAALSATATNAVIEVLRFSKVDLTSPIENHETGFANNTAAYSDSIDGTARGMLVTFVSMRERTHTAGSGATEQNETHAASGATDASLAANTLSLAATGTQAYSGTLSGNAHWTLVALTLTPREAIDPQIRVTYQVTGDPVGATSMLATLDSTSDSVFTQDVSSDRVWTFADIDTTTLFVTAEVLGAADAEIDAAYLEITESSAGGTAVVTYLWVGEVAD